MEWFAKAASQSVNNLKFNPIAPEEMVSYYTTGRFFLSSANVHKYFGLKIEVVTQNNIKHNELKVPSHFLT